MMYLESKGIKNRAAMLMACPIQEVSKPVL